MEAEEAKGYYYYTVSNSFVHATHDKKLETN